MEPEWRLAGTPFCRHETAQRQARLGSYQINHGTPSARIEKGTILYSILRSPAFGHGLEHYCINYPMPTSGLKDGGWHFFQFSILPKFGEVRMRSRR